MGKKKKRALLILMILAGVILAVLIYLVSVWFLSDRIVRLEFNGFENFFNVHDEYHAVAGPFHARMPASLAQSFFDEELDNISDISAETGRNFFVQATWSKNGRPEFERRKTLIHSYDAHYVFEVSNPGPEVIEITRDEERIMLEIAEHFYDFSSPYVYSDDNWLAGNDAHMTFLSYSVYFNGNKVFFEVHHPKQGYSLWSYDNGHFVRIMGVPEKGDFDLVMWKKQE